MTVSATVQTHIAYDLVDEHHPEVTVIEFLSREIVGPHQAEELREQLESLVWSGVPRNFVIDFAHVRALGSSAFGVIAVFVRKYGHVRACNVSNSLRLGAAMTGLENWVQFAEGRDAVIREARKDARRGQDETEDYPAMTEEHSESSHVQS
jgi:anti-anti-sigma regulatory factor